MCRARTIHAWCAWCGLFSVEITYSIPHYIYYIHWSNYVNRNQNVHECPKNSQHWWHILPKYRFTDRNTHITCEILEIEISNGWCGMSFRVLYFVDMLTGVKRVKQLNSTLPRPSTPLKILKNPKINKILKWYIFVWKILLKSWNGVPCSWT